MRCSIHNRNLLRLGDRDMCPACLADGSAGASRLLSSLHERQAAINLCVRQAEAGIPPEFEGKSFADFTPESDKARKLVETLRSYCASFDTWRHKRKGFVFIGMPGTAKTHLACAMVNAIVSKGLRAGYSSLPRLTRDIRAAYGRQRGVDELLRKLIAFDFLVLDEIDLHGSSDTDYNMLYDIINSRYEKAGFPTLAISNRPLEHLQRDLDERVVSRILAGTAPVVFDWKGRRDTRRRFATAEGEQ